MTCCSFQFVGVRENCINPTKDDQVDNVSNVNWDGHDECIDQTEDRVDTMTEHCEIRDMSWIIWVVNCSPVDKSDNIGQGAGDAERNPDAIVDET